MLAAIQHGCVINALDCMYSKLTPEDELLIYSKHVEDIDWYKFRKKVHLVGSYYANRLLNCEPVGVTNFFNTPLGFIVQVQNVRQLLH